MSNEVPFGPLTRRALSEEVLGALHAIVAILLFQAGWPILAWVFVVRAGTDYLGAIYFAVKAVKHKSEDTQ